MVQSFLFFTLMTLPCFQYTFIKYIVLFIANRKCTLKLLFYTFLYNIQFGRKKEDMKVSNNEIGDKNQ